MGLFSHVFPLHEAAGLIDLHSVPSEDENSLHIDEKYSLKMLFFGGALIRLSLCSN